MASAAADESYLSLVACCAWGAGSCAIAATVCFWRTRPSSSSGLAEDEGDGDSVDSDDVGDGDDEAHEDVGL